MKTGQQFKVKDYEGFKEAMNVYDFKNPRVADERFKELGYRYVTKFPTHIDISQRIEHYELVDNPIGGLFTAPLIDSSVDQDSGLHYVKEKEEAVDWDSISETLDDFKKSGIPMEVLISRANKMQEVIDRLNGDDDDDFTSILSEKMSDLEKERVKPQGLESFFGDIEDLDKNSVKPKHYEILGMEVKDINEELLNKIQSSDFDMSLNEAGWYQQAMQYFFRFYAKNGVEDLEKGIEAMRILVASLKSEE